MAANKTVFKKWQGKPISNYKHAQTVLNGMQKQMGNDVSLLRGSGLSGCRITFKAVFGDSPLVKRASAV